jgi:hypothetical protein
MATRGGVGADSSRNLKLRSGISGALGIIMTWHTVIVDMILDVEMWSTERSARIGCKLLIHNNVALFWSRMLQSGFALLRIFQRLKILVAAVDSPKDGVVDQDS